MAVDAAHDPHRQTGRRVADVDPDERLVGVGELPVREWVRSAADGATELRVEPAEVWPSSWPPYQSPKEPSKSQPKVDGPVGPEATVPGCGVCGISDARPRMKNPPGDPRLSFTMP